MDIETKMELVKRKPTEELVTDGDLRRIFESYSAPKHYIGFEISGKVHLGTGLCTALKLRDFLAAGIKPTVFLADYHSYINGKLGGDLEKIRAVAKGYFRHAFVSLGLGEDNVQYVLASEVYDNDYWKEVLRIAKDTTVNRMLRCITIMGRKESEATPSAVVFYPAMQAADIFLLGVQIAHAGMDQRKVHMLARELSHSYRKDFVAVHGHLLPGLQGVQRMSPSADGEHARHRSVDGDMDAAKAGSPVAKENKQIEAEDREQTVIDAKMSKSVPSSAIFIHDSEEEIRAKLKKAYCPEKITEGNPLVEYAEYLILRDKALKVERPAKFGGDIEFADAAELKAVYAEGKLHPMDLKNAVGRELCEILKPSREYFAKNAHYLEQLSAKDITR